MTKWYLLTAPKQKPRSHFETTGPSIKPLAQNLDYMKITTYILILISSTIFGCSKENDLEPENPITEGIIYTELIPSIQITSVDSLIYHGSGCGYVPSPSDSSASISLDINHDNIVDFTLSCNSWYNFVSASGPCANYNTSIVLSGTSDKNKVGITENYNSVKRYVLDEEIGNSQQWSSTAMLMLSSVTAPFQTNFNDTVYLGLKINTDEGDYFGWIYMDKDGYDVTVLSYALNQSAHRSINAGQTE